MVSCSLEECGLDTLPSPTSSTLRLWTTGMSR